MAVDSNLIENSDITEFEKLLVDVDAAKPGELVTGEVVEIGRDYVTIDIGYKSEGSIPKVQFNDKEGKLSIDVGDQVEVLMLAPENEDGEIVLSKDRAEQLKTWILLEESYAANKTVEGTVVQKVKGGLQVDVGVPAFLPGSQVDIRPQRNLGKFVGDSFDFRILKVNRDRGNIVLSRRVVLEQERDALKKDTISQLSEGVVMEGVVKNVTDYGAFIDLGGIDGLLHITDISWGRVNHPKEMLTVGQTVPVVILKYDRDQERVSLGMKQLHDNPWASVEERYQPGTVVSGKVVTIADYGAFIKLEEGVEGLVHVSELSWSKKAKHPNKILEMEQELEAVVLEVSAEQQRISLGVKQLSPNPWEELTTEFPIGTKVTGKVRSIMEFGMFINVKEEIDGLVHVSDFSWTNKIRSGKDIQDHYNKGDEVEAVVLEIDPDEERLSLGIKQLTPDIWDTVPQRYPVGAKVKGRLSSITDFGVFVELEDGVEGLIHISQLGLNRGEEIKEKFQQGQEVEAYVGSVEQSERRISLTIKANARKGGTDYAQYMDDGGAVTFGDLMQQQIDQGKKD